MTEEIQAKLSRVTSGPGVYLMKDATGEVIYVGKARDLKKRLSSYFVKPAWPDAKTGILVRRISDFDTIVTETEKEALILESNLIKRYRPRYNVILKDDKRYPSLRLDLAEPYPGLAIVRKIKNDGALYFGPFSSANAVRQTLKFIQKTFKLRKCRAGELKRRIRPCLHCQMQGCLAPCCMDVDRAVYAEMVQEVVLFLKGHAQDLLREIKGRMAQAAQSEDFEKAAALRDKMFAIEKTIEKQVAVTADFKDRDVLGIAGSSNLSLITVLFVRDGFLMGTRHFSFTETMADDAETVSAFIRQYYEKIPFVPQEILVPIELEDAPLLEEWLKRERDASVSILRPRRGEKVRLARMAARNAQIGLKDAIASLTGSRDMLSRLQAKLGLSRVPARIECFDNSNLAGTEPVSSMVVFEDGKPKKSAYRRYRIKTVAGQDDYAYMAEVLARRYAKGSGSEPYPDLLMVDGGKGQLNIALAVVGEAIPEHRLDMIGIAKKDEKKGETQDKVFLPGRANPVIFGREGDLLLFLQRIRDEAHRFAISFQRKRRGTTAIRSALDDIPGIGRKRKEALLKHFGSIKNIRAATLHELSALPGMNQRAAEAVHKGLVVQSKHLLEGAKVSDSPLEGAKVSDSPLEGG